MSDAPTEDLHTNKNPDYDPDNDPYWIERRQKIKNHRRAETKAAVRSVAAMSRTMGCLASLGSLFLGIGIVLVLALGWTVTALQDSDPTAGKGPLLFGIFVVAGCLAGLGIVVWAMYRRVKGGVASAATEWDAVPELNDPAPD